MPSLKIGDVIRDNIGREGLVMERSRAPSAKWLKEQDDHRMRSATGPWWNVAPLDGGDVLVSEDLAVHLRRASVDDVARVMDADETDNGRATLLHLFAELRSAQVPRKKRQRRTR